MRDFFCFVEPSRLLWHLCYGFVLNRMVVAFGRAIRPTLLRKLNFPSRMIYCSMDVSTMYSRALCFRPLWCMIRSYW